MSPPAHILVPARHASTRFPGKPLAPIRGAGGAACSLVERSWRAAMAVPGIASVWIATDDAAIAAHARCFGAQVVMTAEANRNGTERVAEAAATLDLEPEAIVVNLQGDAPLTPPGWITALVEAMAADPAIAVATPVVAADAATIAHLRADRRAGRVGATTAVIGRGGDALYFSKEVLPHRPESDTRTPVFHHVGAYAYRRRALDAYRAWPPGPLEQAEGLEQLRFLECGMAVRCVSVPAPPHPFWEVNNPEDIARVEAILAAAGLP